jgi:membrane-anchored protein YejM (alkaline phosphatase superfamily)
MFMGRVMDELNKRNLTDNTVILFMGDNGYYMGERGFAGKWSHYEQSLRVPLVIHDPSSKDKPGEISSKDRAMSQTPVVDALRLLSQRPYSSNGCRTSEDLAATGNLRASQSV